MKQMYCRRDMRSEHGVLSCIRYNKRYPKWYVTYKLYKTFNRKEKQKWKLCVLNDDNSMG